MTSTALSAAAWPILNVGDVGVALALEIYVIIRRSQRCLEPHPPAGPRPSRFAPAAAAGAQTGGGTGNLRVNTLPPSPAPFLHAWRRRQLALIVPAQYSYQGATPGPCAFGYPAIWLSSCQVFQLSS